MRPELAHIDRMDALRRQHEAELAGRAREDDDDDAPSLRAIGVQYRKADSDRVAEIKRSSYAYLQDKIEREKWVDLEIMPRQVGFKSLSYSYLNSQRMLVNHCMHLHQMQLDETQNTFERLISESAELLPFQYDLPQLMATCNPPVADVTRNFTYGTNYFQPWNDLASKQSAIWFRDFFISQLCFSQSNHKGDGGVPHARSSALDGARSADAGLAHQLYGCSSQIQQIFLLILCS